ncbi:hypothetical protein JCM8208_000241 [Rhodotorula glutinis]
MAPRASTRASTSAAAGSKAPVAPPTPPAPPVSGQYDVVLNVQDGDKCLTVWLNNDEAVELSSAPGGSNDALKRQRRDPVRPGPHTRHVELTTEGKKTVFSMSTTYGSAGRELDQDKEVEIDEPARCSSPPAKKRKVDPVVPVVPAPVAPKAPEKKVHDDLFTVFVNRTGLWDDRPLEVSVRPSTPVAKLMRAVVDRMGTPGARHGFRLDGHALRYEEGALLGDVLRGVYEDYGECVLEFETHLVGGKPVIYLFPPSSVPRAVVSLALSPEWTFSALYPDVDIIKDVVEEGAERVKERVEWVVAAEPDGSLVELSSRLELSYLFWEATSTGIITSSPSHAAQQVDREPSFHPSSPSLDPSNGVVLPFSPFLAHLDAALSSLTLHTSARNDFITFWLPHFTRIRDAGHDVLFRFLPQAEYARAAQLDVGPKPDVVTRVFLLFKGVETGTASGTSAAEVDWASVVGVDEVKARDESLFRVLEWGGMECV